jgi:asparagine synthase (glutamine-hydrolysing)
MSSYWYRLMFDEHFPPQCASTVRRWTPKWSNQTDPSGRYVDSILATSCDLN